MRTRRRPVRPDYTRGRRDGTATRTRGEGSAGAALVEFAIVMPLLFMLVLGLVSGGIALDRKQQITHAVREGARYGATVSPSQTFVVGTWSSNVRDVVVERSDGALTAADVCVSLVSGSGPAATVVQSTAGGACIPGQTFAVTIGDGGLRVQVTASRPATIQLGPFGAHETTLATAATVRSEVP